MGSSFSILLKARKEKIDNRKRKERKEVCAYPYTELPF
jgi:hypothetical protein